MSQREVAIVGKNNTKAAVTGQEELLVKINSSVPLTVTPAAAIGVQKDPNFNRYSGTNAFIGPSVNRISFSSVGTANALINGVILKPGETINFEAGAPANYFPSNNFSVNTTTAGAEVIVLWID